MLQLPAPRCKPVWSSRKANTLTMVVNPVPIPEPPGLPFLGHVGNIDREFPLGSLRALAEQYGEAYRLRFPGRTVVFVSTHAIVNETCDEKRFKKAISSTLEVSDVALLTLFPSWPLRLLRHVQNLRDGVHDGLFTAREEEENWGIAHRVLMPAFGPMSIRDMFSEMHDIASQLALKWARYGPDTPIVVTDDFTRLTLDTLALCSMGYRFNSFYSPVLHPFIEAMGGFLVESGRKVGRIPLPWPFYKDNDQKIQHDISTMRKTAKEVLDSRKANKPDRRDLLTAMLEGVDPRTGKHMTDDSIMDNLITFLIAGHETTSGLLSFAFYQLLKHPEAYRKAQEEVDSVCGTGSITVEHMSKLPYINGVLRETLRVNATIPAYAVEAREDTLIAGKYPVTKGETILNLLAMAHLDPKVYGDDADQFKPERMLDAEFNKRSKDFPNCWKPFGNGVRGCIGRPFAWQEALLVMAMLLQNFNFVLDPNYQFAVKQTLTIKPKDMHMYAILRKGLTPTTLERRLAGQPGNAETNGKAAHDHHGNPVSAGGDRGVPLTVLYGSNSGTCESLAQRIASDAPEHGFYATKVDCLDSANESLPTNQAVIIVTASYEGQPPDNAGHFVSWLEGLAKNGESKPLKGVNYAVYGCGHREWAQTFHRVPKLIDTSLEQAGACRLTDPGLTDVSNGEVFTDFETWEDESLWPALKKKHASNSENDGGSKVKGVDVVVSTPRTSTLRQAVRPAKVVNATVLTKAGGEPGHGVKKHVEVELPENMTYQTGDYLAVLPINPKESVDRVLRRFGLSRDAHLGISSGGPTFLPVNEPIPAHDLLSSYVELSQPTTKRSLLTLVEYAKDAVTKTELTRLAGDAYTEEIVSKRTSILDVLERFPSTIDLPIGHATLTFSVIGGDLAHSGTGQLYMGVASNFLNSLAEKDVIHVGIRPPAGSHFRLPADPSKTPIICIAAGTGLAPFRAFIQERAAMMAAGRTDLAPALLFFGCRSPHHDDLYREELDKWQEMGAVDMRRAYSRAADQSHGCKHVQDRMWADREDVVELWRRDAKVYVCGSRAVANAARGMAVKLRVEMLRTVKGEETTEEEAAEWLEAQRNVRYVMDVFD
ncbi:hypothetical protein NLU13_2012 [Sarocladium strictum]|uniref:Bifunctional cytochrome P450/NADPH--P450 reductase n=1 Tax=Sarocladium strictum TaxID=5046 RepID=A0AA39GUU1_SARSR|nr:hypothetical protein NLU13_2012 [Sarocladium strictum]